jgi:alginate O-acetyltransferase complex protein AlgI
MVFSSPVFVFLFLPLVLALYYVLPAKLRGPRNGVLLLFSLLFYAWGEPVYILLMLLSIGLNYLFGRLLGKDKHRKTVLVIACMVNIGLLIVFKYTGLLLESFNALLGASLPVPEIRLPIGISFFTFQALSYVIDVYRGTTQPQRSLPALALYISLFPQLIAGPIVRYHDVAEQIARRQESWEKFALGARRFIIGMGKKMLIANTMAQAVDQIFALDPTLIGAPLAWAGILCYALQIYFDFSGYSCMAIGLGSMFGFDFLENFDHPYAARSVAQFWRKWHMSLSGWFRDYVYIPLGGNRKGLARTCLNTLIVFALTGIWHGASWNFLIFGLISGCFIVLERLGLLKPAKWPAPLAMLYTLLVWLFSLVFFRAEGFSGALGYLGSLLGLHGSALSALTFSQVATPLAIAAFIAGWILSQPLADRLPQNTRSLRGLSWAAVAAVWVLCIFNLASATYNPFIYFRF